MRTFFWFLAIIVVTVLAAAVLAYPVYVGLHPHFPEWWFDMPSVTHTGIHPAIDCPIPGSESRPNPGTTNGLSQCPRPQSTPSKRCYTTTPPCNCTRPQRK